MYENAQFIHFFLAITSLLDTSIKLCRNEDTFTQNAEAYLNYFKSKYDGRFGVTKLFMYGEYVYAKYY